MKDTRDTDAGNAADSPGSTVVGRLTDLAPWEAELIVAMRLWMHGPEGQAEVWNAFARRLGSAAGRVELRRFEALLTGLCAYARRPLVRHGPGCACIGSDEAILRTLVRNAAQGDLAEAAMIASLLVPARHAESIAGLAAQVGHALQRIAPGETDPPRAAPRNTPRWLH